MIPRLAQFRRVLPDIGFQFETSHTALDPHDLEVDVAIRLGSGDWPDLTSHYLFDEELLPVGSPTLSCGRRLHRRARLRAPRAAPCPAAAQRLGELASLRRDSTHVDAHGGMRFDHSGMVYQAAINGLGLAMAQTAHVREELAQHRLVPFADAPMKTNRAYYLVHLPSRARDPVIAAFVRWLIGELNGELDRARQRA